jgi:hypothetical protein
MKMNLNLPANYETLSAEEKVKARQVAVAARRAEIRAELKARADRKEERKACRNANIVLGKIAATEKGKAHAAAWLENHDYEIVA